MPLSPSAWQKIRQNMSLFLELGKPEAAEELLQAAIKTHGNDHRMTQSLGLVFYQQSKFPEALEQFQKSVSQNPSAPESHLCLIAALCDMGFYQQASWAAREMAANPGLNIPEKNPDLLRRQAEFHERSGLHYERLGLFHQAINEYRQALKLCDSFARVRLRLAEIFISRELFDDARRELEEARLSDPDSCQIQILLGLMYYRQGLKDQAKRAWEKAHHSAPGNPTARAYFNLSKCWHPSPNAPSGSPGLPS